MYQIKSLTCRLERSTKPRSQLLGSPAAAQALFISLKQTGLGLQPNSVSPLPFQRNGESLPADLTALLPPQPGAILRPSPRQTLLPPWHCSFLFLPHTCNGTCRHVVSEEFLKAPPHRTILLLFSSFLMLNKSATCAGSFEPARSPVNLHQKSGSQVQSCLGRLKDKAL